MKYDRRLSYVDLYETLLCILNEDIFVKDFEHSSLTEELLYYLFYDDFVIVASNQRILLTTKGIKLLQVLLPIVELTKNSNKLLNSL